MISVGRVMEFSAMTNATAPKSSEQISERKTSTLAADNTDKFIQSGATFTQAYTKATVTDNRSNNTSTSTMPDSNDAVEQARGREEREREEETTIKDEPAVPEQIIEERPLSAIMRDFSRQTMGGQVEDTRKTDAQRELDEILGTLSDEELDEHYWSAENTAYRILAFAEELAGGDGSAYGELRKAFYDGFRDCEASFGGKINMPPVSYETYDLIQNGFDFFQKSTGAEPALPNRL